MFEIASLNFAFFFFFRESSIYFEKPLIFSGILFPWPKLLRNAGNLSPGYYIVFNFLHLVVFLVFKRYVAFLNFFYSSRGFPNVVKTTFMQYDKNRCFEVVVHIMSISKHLKCINYRVCPIYSKQFKGLERLKNIPCLVMNVEEMKFILTKTTFLEDNSVNMSLWTRNFQKFLSDDGNESFQYNPPLPPSLDSTYKDPWRKSWLQKVGKAPNQNRPGRASHNVMWRI